MKKLVGVEKSDTKVDGGGNRGKIKQEGRQHEDVEGEKGLTLNTHVLNSKLDAQEEELSVAHNQNDVSELFGQNSTTSLGQFRKDSSVQGFMQTSAQDEISQNARKEVAIERNEVRFKEGNKGVSEKQMIPETRCINRIQEQLLKKGDTQKEKEVNKLSLEGTYLNSQNSFAMLDNEVIVDMASIMGVEIPELLFDSIDIMKDLEIARHVLDKLNLRLFLLLPLMKK
jgi:hypothetical protein